MRTLPLAMILALAAGGCSQKAEVAPAAPAADAAAAPMELRSPKAKEYAEAAPASADVAAAPDVATPSDPASTAPRIAPGPPMLAYSYTYGLSLPHDHVDALRRRHEAACAKAGYQVCQVVSTSIHDLGHGAVNGDLELRAAPAWLQRFKDGLETEAKEAGGKVQTSEVTSEDLAKDIVDTSAQLKAKLVLRDRLQALLANRPGRLADLLAVERELARVQGEIDSTQSQLTVMQGRVAMSDVTINYSSADVLGGTVRSPLAQAFSSFFGNVAGSLAMMVDLLAVLLPWLLVLGVLGWLFRKRLARLKWPFPRKAKAAASS